MKTERFILKVSNALTHGFTVGEMTDAHFYDDSIGMMVTFTADYDGERIHTYKCTYNYDERTQSIFCCRR